MSKRTVYRDVADLIGQRVPIEGEAGLGYLIASDYDMPPLMLTPDEIEAVMLGAQWVAGRSDKALANAARDVMAKIAAVVPEHLRPFIVEPSVGVKPALTAPKESVDPSSLRSAIRNGRKLRLRYQSEAGEESERKVWPVILGYAETRACWSRGASCARFSAFSHGPYVEAETLDENFGLRHGGFLRRWRHWRERTRPQGFARESAAAQPAAA